MFLIKITEVGQEWSNAMTTSDPNGMITITCSDISKTYLLSEVGKIEIELGPNPEGITISLTQSMSATISGGESLLLRSFKPL